MKCEICCTDNATYDAKIACQNCDKNVCVECINKWATIQLESYNRYNNVVSCAFCRVAMDITSLLYYSPPDIRPVIEKKVLHNHLTYGRTDIHRCTRCGLAHFYQDDNIDMAKCRDCGFKWEIQSARNTTETSIWSIFWSLCPCCYLCFPNHRSSVDWISYHCKPCPRCNTMIFKDGGCNHVHCTMCGTNFCWDCLVSATQHGRLCGFKDTGFYVLILCIFVICLGILEFVMVPDVLGLFFYQVYMTGTLSGVLLIFVLFAWINILVIRWFSEDIWAYFSAPYSRRTFFQSTFMFSFSLMVGLVGLICWVSFVLAMAWSTCVLVICFAEYRDIIPFPSNEISSDTHVDSD